MNIVVQLDLNRGKQQITIDPDQTVLHLRAAIGAIDEGIPSYRLIFDGKPLLDNVTMAEAGIKEGDTVRVIIFDWRGC